MKNNQTIKRLLLLGLFLVLATGSNAVGQKNQKPKNQIPAESAGVVRKFGVFTNMRFTEEHQYGNSVELWQDKDRLFGFFLVSEGLIGDTPTGMLEDVVFNSKTGKLSFKARLSTGTTFDENKQQVPSRDGYEFKGILKGAKLTGVLEYTNALAVSARSTKTNVTLRKSKSESESMSEAASYDEWKKAADEILKLRGPKW